jgi:hypothetical protein
MPADLYNLLLTVTAGKKVLLLRMTAVLMPVETSEES